MNQEQLEHWALERLAGATGKYPLPPNDMADSVFIGFPVERPDRPVAIFEKSGATVALIEFEVRVVPAHERTDYTHRGEGEA